MTTNILTEIAGGVLTLRFNRPDKKNAITRDMYAAMADAMRAGQKDKNVRVIVITGEGADFTAGNDLKDFVENPPKDANAPVFQFMAAMCDVHKPIIAAVNGLAIGIGVTLLLHCDFAYAVPGARFQMPFVNLAVVPEFGASLLLTHMVGARKASELLMMGDPFSAEDALKYGLLTDIVAPDELMNVVRKKAAALSAKAPGAVRETKALIRANHKEVSARIALEIEHFAKRLETPEFKEAVQSFFEKRAPDFSKFE